MSDQFPGMVPVKASQLGRFAGRRGIIAAGRGVGIPFTIRGTRTDPDTGAIIVDVTTPVPQLVELSLHPDTVVHIQPATPGGRGAGRPGSWGDAS